MPLDIRYNPEKRIVYATFDEQIHLNEFLDAMKKITDTCDYPPDVSVLWDARSINMPIANNEFLLDLIEIRKRFPERGKARVAIIASSDFVFGMSRMYELLSGDMPQNVMVFRNYSDGEKWLMNG